MMTTTQAPSVIQMGREQLANLLTAVNETVATDVAYFEGGQKRKSFNNIQLWNIRRKARYSGVVVR